MLSRPAQGSLLMLRALCCECESPLQGKTLSTQPLTIEFASLASKKTKQRGQSKEQRHTKRYATACTCCLLFTVSPSKGTLDFVGRGNSSTSADDCNESKIRLSSFACPSDLAGRALPSDAHMRLKMMMMHVCVCFCVSRSRPSSR